MAFKQPKRREIRPNVRVAQPEKVVQAYELLSEIAFDYQVKHELERLSEEDNGSSAA